MSLSLSPIATGTEKELRRVGFWRNEWDEATKSLPDPRSMVDPSWSLKHRTQVADYLRRGQKGNAYQGYSTCRFECGIPDRFMGCHDLHDDAFLWPEGFPHYVAFHGVKPSDELLEHIAPRLQRLMPWWRLVAWFRRLQTRLRIAAGRRAAAREALKGPETTKLLTAARVGDLRGVQRALESADVDERNRSGSTALLEASFAGHLDIVLELLDRGADPNAQDDIGTTPLMKASNADIALRLIDAGADVNPEHDCHTTPLRDAASRRDLQRVLLLLERGAEVDAADKFGRTPLCTTHTIEIAEVLLAHGASVNASTDKGYMPIHSAARADDTELLRLYLRRGADINALSDDGETPLLRAAGIRHGEDAVAFLLDAGADATIVSERCETALMHASVHGLRDSVERLLQAGSPIDTVDPRGMGVLIWAALARDNRDQIPAVIELLLDAGADPCQRDELGRTALFICVQQRKLEAVRALMAAGADPDLATKERITARDVAAELGDSALINLLG